MVYHGAIDEPILQHVMSTSADGQELHPDEGSSRSRGALPRHHIDNAAQQRGRAKGFFGAGGNNSGNRTNFGGSDEMVGAGGLDAPARRRNWAAQTGISGRGDPSVSSPISHHNTRSIARIPPRGGQYGGGGRDTH
jgi:hypothetical protein